MLITAKLGCIYIDVCMITMTYKPHFYRLTNYDESSAFEQLIRDKSPRKIDTIASQLRELVLCQNPSIAKSDPKVNELISEKLNSVDGKSDHYGVWVYYSWSNTLIHILDEKEFIEVRTNRNNYKITPEEQEKLRSKVIGIAGLSVGRSAAVTLALERVGGEIRLADFDELELSNLNRIKAPLACIGLNKAISTAREIAEMDPFINVVCFDQGLNEANLHEFFTQGSKLDLFVEECDDIKIKILSRQKAKELQVPVIMETSDNCIIDIERFDLEPERPIIHGQLEGLSLEQVKELKTQEEKLPFITRFSGVDTLSPRMKSSMIEIERTIRTWPQLASDVTYGAGLVTYMSREILLGHLSESGRYSGDIKDIFKQKMNAPKQSSGAILSTNEQVGAVIKRLKPIGTRSEVEIPKSILEKMVKDSLRATTLGNLQMLNYAYINNVLYLLYDKERGYSFSDMYGIGSKISLGAILEGLNVSAAYHGYALDINYHPHAEIEEVAAEIVFEPKTKNGYPTESEYLSLHERYTDRSRSNNGKVLGSKIDQLNVSLADTNTRLQYIDDSNKVEALSSILAEIDRIRIQYKNTHADLFNELKFPKEGQELKEGINIDEVDLKPSEKVGFQMTKDYRAIELLNDLDLGSRLGELTSQFISTSSGVGLLTINKQLANQFYEGGRVVQRFWMKCSELGVALHPFTALMFFHEHIKRGNIESPYKERLENKINEFYSYFELEDEMSELFIFRLLNPDKSSTKKVTTKRRDIDEILFTE